jgi:integrase
VKTHEANENALKTLRPMFGSSKLPDIDAPQIEFHLRMRLQQKRHVRRRAGVFELGTLKATSVHQEFRVLRRILSVAVKSKLIVSNPCTAVEFPGMVKGLFRPHYMTWSEQMKIEQHTPEYLRNVIRIVTETGLRGYKELACMRKEQVDVRNKVAFIADSKTPTGISEVPLTDLAVEAFENQLELAGPGPWLFPSVRNRGEHQQDFKKVWQRTLRRAASHTSGSMISDRRMQPGLVPGELQTNGSRRCCCARLMQRCSRNTHR